MEATGQALVDFWAFTAEKGLMNSNTAGSLRGACKEVLSAVDGEDWQAVDIRLVDPEEYVQRFERLRMTKFKPSSLSVYKSRFKNGLQMFLDYLEDPSGWRYKAERPAKDRKKSKDVSGQVEPAAREQSGSPLDSPPPGTSVIEYPFPLRPKLVVKLILPDDMTAREAERLGNFLKSLAYEAPKELTAVSSRPAMGQAS